MNRGLSKTERGGRQRVMIKLRGWMEREGISRQQVADEFGITCGHLRTLINANRTATEDQCQKALILMDDKFVIREKNPSQEELSVKPLRKRKEMRPVPRKKRKAPKPNNLRPLTKVEAKFVKDVAQAWLDNHKNAGQDEFLAVVKALAIGIRS